MTIEQAKTSLSELIKAKYPGYHFQFQCDSEDDSVIYVRIFGIPDDKISEHKAKVWDLIDHIGETEEASFVPSIISMTNTLAHHREFLPVSDDFEQAIPTHVFKIIADWDNSTFKPHLCNSEIPQSAWSCDTVIDNFEITEDTHNEHSFKLAA